MLSFMPNNIMPKLILLVLGALVLAIIAVSIAERYGKSYYQDHQGTMHMRSICNKGKIGRAHV